MDYLSGTEIEIVRPISTGQIQHALFDFDGTISLIRQGWQDVMVPLMVEMLQEIPAHDTEAELTALVRDYVEESTGKQTIYQMIWLAEAVAERGGDALEPLAYKHIYLERLWERIEDRVKGIKSGRIERRDLMVPGALDMLRQVKTRGLTCYLASGTDRPYVRDEAEALGVADYFDGGIYGALEDYESYSKAMVIDDILQEHQLGGEALVVFGDGFVEIENAKAVGGIAVAVATDEERRQGINAWKRERLLCAGADIVIPDFRQADLLSEYLFEQP